MGPVQIIPMDAISSTKDFILAMYSAVVEEPFCVVASAIWVFVVDL
jgi:hypothetical protein